MERVYWHLIILALVVSAITVRGIYDVRQYQYTRTDMYTHMFSSWKFNWGDMTRLAVCFLVLAQMLGLEILPAHFNPVIDTVVRGIGVCCGVVGLIFVTWPRIVWEYTWAGGLTLPTKIQNHDLVTAGPYRFMRHPFYFGSIIGFAGIELVVASYLAPVIPLLCFIELNKVAKEEEVHLTQHYRAQYSEYVKRSRRFFPLPRFS